MAKIDIDVTVKYTASVSDVEVSDSFAELLAKFTHHTVEPCAKGDAEKVANWIADNINERDCYEYEAEIDDLYINGEPI